MQYISPKLYIYIYIYIYMYVCMYVYVYVYVYMHQFVKFKEFELSVYSKIFRIYDNHIENILMIFYLLLYDFI